MFKKCVILAPVLFCFAFAAFGDSDVTFNYQGRVKVGGSDHQGTGYFKFAIMNTSASATLWSNDGTASGEPSTSVPLTVTNGIFSVSIGDSSLGMQGINSSVFNSKEPLKLRSWFSNGVLGFEQLTPDTKLVNLTLNTLQTGTSDFTIYVNGTTGDNGDNGLTTSTAKRTIQAAVNIVPPRLNSNVTIHIASGVYRELVSLNGFSTDLDKSLLLVGDESWTPASASPNVRITGTDDDGTHVKSRTYGVFASQCSGIVVKGILFDYCTIGGFWGQNGNYTVLNCQATNNGGGVNPDGMGGFVGIYQSKVAFTNCDSRSNQSTGFFVGLSSRTDLTSCSSIANTGEGFHLTGQSSARLWTVVDFSQNTDNGILVQVADLGFQPVITGSIKNNTGYGVAVQYNAFIHYYPGSITLSGNGLGSLSLLYGGSSY